MKIGFKQGNEEEYYEDEFVDLPTPSPGTIISLNPNEDEVDDIDEWDGIIFNINVRLWRFNFHISIEKI